MNLEALQAAERWQSMLDHYKAIEKPFASDLSSLLADLHHHCSLNRINLSDALRDGHLIYNHEWHDYYSKGLDNE